MIIVHDPTGQRYSNVVRWCAVNRARPGQMVFTGAIMLTCLLAMTGLAVDVGLWLVAKTRLQRAVDAAALSVVLDRPTPNQANGNNINSPVGGATRVATVRSRAIVLNQGVEATSLVDLNTAVPRTNRFSVRATQRVGTTFARVIGVNSANVVAQATADINAYLEIPVAPICGAANVVACDGQVGDSTMDAFGVNRPPAFGDAYENPTGPWYFDSSGQPVLPRGYQYRVHIQPSYSGMMVIQGWDLDGFNRGDPTRCLTAPYGGTWNAATSSWDCSGGSNNPRYANDSAALSATGQTNNSYPAVIVDGDGFPTASPGWHKFYRMDECMTTAFSPNPSSNICADVRAQTPLRFTFWSLDPAAPDPWNPTTGAGGERQELGVVTVCGAGSPSAPCTITYDCQLPLGNQTTCIDLRWVELYRLNVNTLPAAVDGSRSLYIDVEVMGATESENVYNLRSGPPPQSVEPTSPQFACQPSGVVTGPVGGPIGSQANWQHVDTQRSCRWMSDRGAPGTLTKILARRSMPTNVVAAGNAPPYRVWLGWIPRAAAGQTLRLRNYDLDGPGCAGGLDPTTNAVTYRGYFPGSGRLGVSASMFCGSRGGDNVVGPGNADDWADDVWTVPPLTNTAFWGADDGFWLYADVFQKPGSSPFWDTAVWEVIFDRARLVN